VTRAGRGPLEAGPLAGRDDIVVPVEIAHEALAPAVVVIAEVEAGGLVLGEGGRGAGKHKAGAAAAHGVPSD